MPLLGFIFHDNWLGRRFGFSQPVGVDWKTRCAVVIPCLNEAGTIATVVVGAATHLPSVIVVDDGSNDPTARLAQESGAVVIKHITNQGKGAAVVSGIRAARGKGFSWAVLMDGDGQHSPDEIPALLNVADTTNASLVAGNRMGAPGPMPLIRRWTNRLMSGVLSRLTGHVFPDTQCGFRLVNLDAWAQVEIRSSRFEIESEMLVAFLSAGQRVAFAPVQSIYKRSQSKIQPCRDTARWLLWLFKSRRQFAAIRSGVMMRLPLEK